MSTAVLLWVRIHPERDNGRGVAVRAEAAPAPDMSDLVWTGEKTETDETDHCATVDAVGLEPGTTYWYQFVVGDERSPVGRTRTAPAAGADHVRLAAFSCQRITHGWFTAHADLARRAEDPATDVDLVLCLGDHAGRRAARAVDRRPGRIRSPLEGDRQPADVLALADRPAISRPVARGRYLPRMAIRPTT